MVASTPRHILSFDVENWFDGNLHRRWTYHPGATDERLDREVPALLDVLGKHDTRATFFILGGVAASHPHLVRRIAEAGHEVGCHAWSHDLLRDSTPDRYLAGLQRCRALLQDLTGQPVSGHRAPSWSVDRRVPWAVSTLVQAGFGYDSSVFPMRTPLYGEPTSPTTPYWLAGPDGSRILELPPAVRRMAGLSLPFGGGLYWRLLPGWLIRLLLAHSDGPAVTYLHPWELNPEPIALPPDLPLIARVALRYGVAAASPRLEALLTEFRFEPFAALLSRQTLPEPLPTVMLGR